MKRQERARALRGLGTPVAKIAEQLGITEGYARNCLIAFEHNLVDSAERVVRYAAHNGGCSTRSGLMAISMPRIPSLHGALS